ncbi:MAG: DUF3800 domain-containing protein [Candidatus Sungiibacteriota bacterium]
MLVFIDESGDTGLDIAQGASRYFIIVLVLFEDDDEATACDQRIQLLKKELNYREDFEFHFYNNSDRVRKRFLEAVAPYNFFYLGIAVNKDPKRLFGEGFRHKESFYKYACGLVFENAKPYLKDTKVKIDKSGRAVFRNELAKYLQHRVNAESDRLIKNVKMEPSHSNNLLQLADYVAGTINRTLQQKKNYETYHRYIRPKEISLQMWPK